jgi:hypothetical protein
MAARVDYIRKNHGRTAKHVIFENAAGIDGNVILNFYVIAYGYIGGHHNILANVAAGADLAVFHDMGEMPNFGMGSDGTGIIHVAGFVYEVVLIIHLFLEAARKKRAGVL